MIDQAKVHIFIEYNWNAPYGMPGDCHPKSWIFAQTKYIHANRARDVREKTEERELFKENL